MAPVDVTSHGMREPPCRPRSSPVALARTVVASLDRRREIRGDDTIDERVERRSTAVVGIWREYPPPVGWWEGCGRCVQRRQAAIRLLHGYPNDNVVAKVRLQCDGELDQFAMRDDREVQRVRQRCELSSLRAHGRPTEIDAPMLESLPVDTSTLVSGRVWCTSGDAGWPCGGWLASYHGTDFPRPRTE